MSKILNYGSLNIDKVFSLDHIVKPGETISSSSFEIHAGGKGENQSGALAKAGMNVYHAGKIGEDGKFLIKLLQEYNVNTDYIKTNAPFTGQAIIQVSKKGQNSIILESGGNFQNSKEEIDEVLSHFSKGDYLILQNEINNVDYLIEKGAQKEMVVCFNPSPFTSDILNYDLSKVSIFFVNEIEAGQIAKIEGDLSYQEILDKVKEIFPSSEIVMTVGKDGAFYDDGEKRLYEPIIDAPVIDTTAAGDTFMGYFIASKLMNYSNQECLYYATKASSITVTKKGALNSIPFKKEVF